MTHGGARKSAAVSADGTDKTCTVASCECDECRQQRSALLGCLNALFFFIAAKHGDKKFDIQLMTLTTPSGQPLLQYLFHLLSLSSSWPFVPVKKISVLILCYLETTMGSLNMLRVSKEAGRDGSASASASGGSWTTKCSEDVALAFEANCNPSIGYPVAFKERWDIARMHVHVPTIRIATGIDDSSVVSLCSSVVYIRIYRASFQFRLQFSTTSCVH